MKAAFLIGPQTFVVRQAPDPELPVGGLLLRVHACGVCGSDLRRWKEGPPAGVDGIIPGHEIAAEVIAVHPELKIKGYQVGDRLAVAPDIHCGRCYYCQRGLFNLCDELHFLGITPGYPGGFAEQMALTPEVLEFGIVHPIPAGMPDQHAALSELCSSILAAHQKNGTGPKDTVVVMGAGPAGCLHMAVAHAHGARVILSEPSPVRRQKALPFQPEAILDPTQEDVVRRVRELTGGRGADIAVCANPVAATQSQAVELVRKGGRVLLYGGLSKAAPQTTLDANRIHYGEICVVGAFSYHPTHHELALEAIQRGLIPADLVITHQFHLDEIVAAFAAASSGDALKVMVLP